jgi:hypothetical protein
MFSKLIQDACKVTQKASQDSCLNTRTSNLYSKRKTVETTPTNQKKPEKHNLAKPTRIQIKQPIPTAILYITSQFTNHKSDPITKLQTKN